VNRPPFHGLDVTLLHCSGTTDNSFCSINCLAASHLKVLPEPDILRCFSVRGDLHAIFPVAAHLADQVERACDDDSVGRAGPVQRVFERGFRFGNDRKMRSMMRRLLPFSFSLPPASLGQVHWLLTRHSTTRAFTTTKTRTAGLDSGQTPAPATSCLDSSELGGGSCASHCEHSQNFRK